MAEAEDLEAGERTFLSVDGEPVGVFNVAGEYYAVQNRCQHQGGPVCTGKVQGILTAEFTSPGERIEEVVTDDPSIACPWHGWEYDLESGEHLGDRDYELKTYRVLEEDGKIFVEREN